MRTRQKKPLLDQVMVATQKEIIHIAGKRLGRVLTEQERAGIGRISSLMMLESIYRSFSEDTTPNATIEADLAYFANKMD